MDRTLLEDARLIVWIAGGVAFIVVMMSIREAVKAMPEQLKSMLSDDELLRRHLRIANDERRKSDDKRLFGEED